MCGRFSLFSEKSVILDYFQLEDMMSFKPNYNITPSMHLPVTHNSTENVRTISLMHWGLIPSWAKEKSISHKLINARSETAFEKPSFRSAFKSRRCLIPASGFYEWQKSDNHKQPFYISPKDQPLFAFAGLWEIWQKEEKPLISFTILTTDAIKSLSKIHHRMPVILKPKYFDEWLDIGNNDVDYLNGFLAHNKPPKSDFYPVSKAVNSPKNNTESCITPLT